VSRRVEGKREQAVDGKSQINRAQIRHRAAEETGGKEKYE
jgi:hypothetical protein